MIEILPLLLGLVSGPYTLEVRASMPVAEMELRLDGETVDVRSEEPFTFECDFSGLRPHVLEAVARDAAGRELARAEQWVNLGLQTARAALVFEGGDGSGPRAVAVVWEGLGRRRPPVVEMTFDGEPLPVADPRRVPLPRYEPDEMHFLSATVTFGDGSQSRLDAGFGGGRGDEIASELTAVAVVLEKGARLPKPGKLAGWFLKDGRPLAVHGVEKGEAEVLVVRDPGLQPVLEDLLEQLAGWDTLARTGLLKDRLQIGPETRLRVMSAATAPLSPAAVAPEMFLQSEGLDAAEKGLLWLGLEHGPQRFPLLFSSATAVAGIQAHAATRRRAVVLLLGDSPAGGEPHTPAEVRDFLRLLHVPLFVWRFDPGSHAAWEDAREIPVAPGERAGHDALTRAIRELRSSLEAQRIVWLEGRHLPQTLELSPRAKGIRLAGCCT